jgi:hypothetical protein
MWLTLGGFLATSQRVPSGAANEEAAPGIEEPGSEGFDSQALIGSPGGEASRGRVLSANGDLGGSMAAFALRARV